MSRDTQPKSHLSFRVRFLRGLGILLPTVLTIWILVAAYRFVNERIADPINRGVRHSVVEFTPWPRLPTDQVQRNLKTDERAEFLAGIIGDEEAMTLARYNLVESWWEKWRVMDLIGLFIAIILIYIVGLILGSYIGKRLYARGEEMLQRVPIFKAVYPYVKQVTDFFVGEKEDKMQFSNVVAVEYPRKGLWSLGLVTGDTMRTIEQRAGENCVTVFVPSSPTPFTGYVITVPQRETIDLDITIDDALRFSVSGGVIVPSSQLIHHGTKADTSAGSTADSSSSANSEEDGKN